MQTMCVVLAYFGPETVMPLTSIVATVGALVAMFGRSIFRLTFGWARAARYRRRGRNATPAPHFAVGRRRISRLESTAASLREDESL